MSAAIMAPSPAPHDRPSFSSPKASSTSNSNSASASASTSNSTSAKHAGESGAPVTASPPTSRSGFSAANTRSSQNQNQNQSQPQNPSQSHRTGSRSPRNTGKPSPSSASRVPTIIVKKEPTSPEMPVTRHRPRKLDLSKSSTAASGAQTARPMTTRDGLGIQEVGIACLSPGLVTQDPNMKEQLQRSMTVREQQRAIIEARLLQQSAKDGGPHGIATAKDGGFSAKTPGMSRRNKAPPGLSIVAPAHEVFQHERVIQSAPLGQTFTGLGHGPHPLTRHITNQPATKLSNTSHIHHVAAHQTSNRLPPLSDVFGAKMNSAHPESANAPANQHLYPAQPMRSAQPLPSPGHAPVMTHGPPTARSREYKSAEEAQAELAGGRPELLPKIVHYGSHQPPTPPSPQPGSHATHAAAAAAQHHPAAAHMAPQHAPAHHAPHPQQAHAHHAPPPPSATKRRRAEYEEGASPPLGHGPAPQRATGPFGYGRDSPETQRAKKEEFLSLCSRAWDLFHS